LPLNRSCSDLSHQCRYGAIRLSLPHQAEFDPFLRLVLKRGRSCRPCARSTQTRLFFCPRPTTHKRRVGGRRRERVFISLCPYGRSSDLLPACQSATHRSPLNGLCSCRAGRRPFAVGIVYSSTLAGDRTLSPHLVDVICAHPRAVRRRPRDRRRRLLLPCALGRLIEFEFHFFPVSARAHSCRGRGA